MTDPPVRTYTLAEVAEGLGVTTGWLADQVRGGQVPHLRMGRRVRFTDMHVAAVLARYTRSSAPPDSGDLGGMSPRSAARLREQAGA